jgi:hypothetical protein
VFVLDDGVGKRPMPDVFAEFKPIETRAHRQEDQETKPEHDGKGRDKDAENVDFLFHELIH